MSMLQTGRQGGHWGWSDFLRGVVSSRGMGEAPVYRSMVMRPIRRSVSSVFEMGSETRVGRVERSHTGIAVLMFISRLSELGTKELSPQISLK